MRGSPGKALEATLQVAERAVPVVVAPHGRARRITLRLARDGAGVRVTVPTWVAPAEGLDFARARIDWIEKHLCNQPGPQPFAHGARIPYRGELHMIFHVPGRRGVVWREGEGEAARLCVAGDERHLPRRLTDWLKEQAKAELARACRHYASALDVRFNRVTVRDQKSRWGSCSSAGNLSFSWRLVLAPTLVLDYVAAHEVTHLLELNHSQRFWQLLRTHCNHVDAAEKWLKAHGRALHAWGARS